MGFFHVLHTASLISFLHFGFRHIEMLIRFCLLRCVCHLCNHVIHKLHVSLSAFSSSKSRRKADGDQESYNRESFDHAITPSACSETTGFELGQTLSQP